MNGLEPPPPFAAWRLHDAHHGFEITYFESAPGGVLLRGTSVGVEDGVPWEFRYEIVVDAGWHVRRAEVGAHGTRRVLERTGSGWHVDGAPRPDLDGVADVDLEGSMVTNTLPLHRLPLPIGVTTRAPAAYVRAATLEVERLEQTYRRIDAPGIAVDYSSPRFGYREVLRFSADGLIDEYPRIGTRIA